MKPIAIIAGIILVLAVCGILLVSGQKEEKSSNDPVRVGMIMIGNRENSSWNASHWQGIQDAARQLNLTIDRDGFMAGLASLDAPMLLWSPMSASPT